MLGYKCEHGLEVDDCILYAMQECHFWIIGVERDLQVGVGWVRHSTCDETTTIMK